MAISQYSGDTNYISQLPDKPVTDGGLTAAQFKAKFDQFGTEFKAWLNGTFVPALNSTFATKATATTSANGLMSTSDKDKLDGIETGAEVNDVTSVAGKTGAVTIASADITDLNTSGKAWAIYVTNTAPTSSSPNGIYLVY